MPDLKNSEKDLVAEQPGLGLSLMGLFLAFFIGLAIRASVSPERVQEHLQKATENIHKDLQVSFKKAYVSFSRGLWPDLSVVVEDVSIESTQMCWLSPLLEVHEIRLPLSLRHLFRGRILIHEIFADEVNLSLRTPYSDCSKKREVQAQSPVVDRKVAQQPVKPVIGQFENVSRRNPIDTLQIEELKIHYLPVAFTSFYVQDFKAHLKSEEPRWLQVMGRLILDGDTLMGDYSSHADLQVDAIEGANINATARGAWREGHYTVATSLDSKSQELSVAVDAQHLPLSQILPLLKKYRWVESEFNGKRAWISGHARMKGPVSKMLESPLDMERLKLEGDLGEVACNQARLHSLQPLKFDPVNFEIRGLNVKELLVFLNRPHPSPALGELGIFTGTAHFVSPEHLVLRGDYSGLEFIFSNQGSRQSQVLSLVSGELDLDQKHWNISIDRVKPVEGVFDGKVTMKADKDFRDLQIDAHITELGLSPKVQGLMTGGGSLGAVSGQLRTRLRSAQIVDLQGQLKWDQLMIEGVRVLRPKMNIQSSGEEIQIKLSASELEMISNSPVIQLFHPIFPNPLKGSLLFKNPSAALRTRRLSNLAWDFQGLNSSGGVWRSVGQWNENSELSGEIRLQGVKSQNWQLLGTRSQPQFRLRPL